MQSGNIGLLIDAVERCVADGDLPHGNDREGIRRLTGAQFGSLSRAVSEAYRVPLKHFRAGRGETYHQAPPFETTVEPLTQSEDLPVHAWQRLTVQSIPRRSRLILVLEMLGPTREVRTPLVKWIRG